MKYLYLILRLFFCPHKWEVFERTKHFGDAIIEHLPIKITFTANCRKCGKIKNFS